MKLPLAAYQIPRYLLQADFHETGTKHNLQSYFSLISYPKITALQY